MLKEEEKAPVKKAGSGTFNHVNHMFFRQVQAIGYRFLAALVQANQRDIGLPDNFGLKLKTS